MCQSFEWVPSAITAFATVGLAGITWSYARTTKKMAASSKDAAEAAQSAAQASQRAAELAAVNTKVEFGIVPHMKVTDEGSSLSAIGVRCEQATIFVHGCRLISISVKQSGHFGSIVKNPLTDKSLPAVMQVGDDYLMDAGGFKVPHIEPPKLPIQLFSGQSINFLPPPGFDLKGEVTSIEVEVLFSFLQGEAPRARFTSGYIGRDWR